MQAAPARYVSVSDLYSTDEVELLLDEIRELEPTSCRGEDVQDFEIAGSGCGGGRSPAGTEATERSWDSHAQYRRAPAPRGRQLAPVYCRLRHLLSARGLAALGVVVCAAAAAVCVWAAVGLRAATLPLAGRVQLLQLAATSAVLLHTLLLVMHVTGLVQLMPIDWNKLGTWTSAWSGLSLLLGALLTLHAVLLAPEYRWTPDHIANLLYSASGLGLGGACLSASLVAAGSRGWCRRWWATRRAGGAGGAGGGGGGAGRGGRTSTKRSSSASLRAAYRAVPHAPLPPLVTAPVAPTAPAVPVPSTSRDNPL